MQVTIQVPAPTPPQPPPIPPEIADIFAQSGPPESVLIASVLVVGIIVAGLILNPLIRAFARRLEGKSVDPGIMAELEQLRARVGELEAGHQRVLELEERVDFSERLLAQSRDAQKAPR